MSKHPEYEYEIKAESWIGGGGPITKTKTAKGASAIIEKFCEAVGHNDSITIRKILKDE